MHLNKIRVERSTCYLQRTTFPLRLIRFPVQVIFSPPLPERIRLEPGRSIFGDIDGSAAQERLRRIKFARAQLAASIYYLRHGKNSPARRVDNDMNPWTCHFVISTSRISFFPLSHSLWKIFGYISCRLLPVAWLTGRFCSFCSYHIEEVIHVLRLVIVYKSYRPGVI